jgi:hypothetical protein
MTAAGRVSRRDEEILTHPRQAAGSLNTFNGTLSELSELSGFGGKPGRNSNGYIGRTREIISSLTLPRT